ncbi:elastase-1-like [Epargyreus clarus]|uniref:elastase-1-like n=1 Tax=Epargyreus clarus TaxID=520877 RepID=UPI003C2D39D9
MTKLIGFFCLSFLSATFGQKVKQWSFSGIPTFQIRNPYPCNDSRDIFFGYDNTLPPGEDNQYSVRIAIELPYASLIHMQFDSEATVVLSNQTASSTRISSNENGFHMKLLRNVRDISFDVKGPQGTTIVPYFKSLVINSQEYCEEPNVGFLDGIVQGYKNTATYRQSAPQGCGRRKVEHTELIVRGEATKPGDWPWHVAIYKRNNANIKYICGGTLISKTAVLTAAHCVTIRGNPVAPELLSVILGKYNLIGGDLETQEREVHSVIAHENFDPKHYLENDIALLKLKSEATYNDYVQPACIWYNQAQERLPSGDVLGSVVGWGFDQTDSLSSQLRQTFMPKIRDVTCIRMNPLFYGNALNDKKFCAGYANGTSACNGDSGGGFVVFVPDEARDTSPKAQGSWYVRGIVSLTVSRKDVALCDPEYYVVFTDVEKYTTWINQHEKPN